MTIIASIPVVKQQRNVRLDGGAEMHLRSCVVSDSLLNRVASGEMVAMQECIERYGGLVWSLARRLFGATADAEDAVQEAFIALWENADRFDASKGSEVTFVAMIARRRLIDRKRKVSRHDQAVAELGALPEPRIAEGETPALTRDEAQRAAEAMDQLSEDQRRVLTLAIHHGLTHEQIAAHSSMPLGTVKTHARRGLMRVRDLLAESQADPAPRSTT